ncbi:MAG: ABC transporter ATP-binding protein [Bacteroidota bacterium]|nr:ABC transporter ATP-binding protein [Bacteroidota bacterium]
MQGISAKPQAAKDFNKTIMKLAGYLLEYKFQIVVVLLFAIFSTTFSIVGPKLLGKVTTKLVEGLLAYASQTGLLTDFVYMGRLSLLLLVLYVVSSICSFFQGFIMSKVSMDITYKIRKQISEKMYRLPLNYYDTRTHGEVLSRITNDVDLVSQSLNQTLSQLVTSVTMILGILVMMLSISWLMTLAALLVIPLSGVIMGLVVNKSQGFFKDQQKSMGEMNSHVEEMISGHNLVQAFNWEKTSIHKFKKINKELFGSAWKSQFVSSIMMPVMTFVGNLGYVVVCILGAYLAVKRVISVGDIQAFIQYTRSFMQPIGQLASISNTLQATVAAAERVFEFLEEDEEEPGKTNIDLNRDFIGNVEFKNVSFGYNSDNVIIKNFSTKVKAGQKIAIVGPTGAGKTTIIKLLMRFYDINSGQILIDGQDIFDFSRQDLRTLFGIVLQDSWLYSASIMDNLRYGTFDATDNQVIAAAKAAHCDEFIRALPGGYNMILNEESTNISQGQKQLFTIARVILNDPKILILDEATSSVDTRTEILIQSAMDALMKGRTSFVIAHRLSTIKNADLILVMKDGDIIEQGNHEDLLSQNGFYADLYNSQFSEGEEE